MDLQLLKEGEAIAVKQTWTLHYTGSEVGKGLSTDTYWKGVRFCEKIIRTVTVEDKAQTTNADENHYSTSMKCIRVRPLIER